MPIPVSKPPAALAPDLAAIEERLKRFDAERDATNAFLKASFPDITIGPVPGSTPPGKDPGTPHPHGPKGHVAKDVYEKPDPNRPDATAKAGGTQGEDVPAVGRPHPHGGARKRTLAEAIAEMSKPIELTSTALLNEGFAVNDLIDHMRDSGAKADIKSFERLFAEKEFFFERERDMTNVDRERLIEQEQLRLKDDVERQRKDDDARRMREDQDRQRRDIEDISRGSRDTDTQRRDADRRREQDDRDRQLRLDDEARLRADRDRNR